MRRAFRTFIGVDLGGGKGKTTAVTRLRLEGPDPAGPGPGPGVISGTGTGIAGPGDATPRVVVEEFGGPGTGKPGRPGTWYDERLIEYLLRYADTAVVAMDAPLTLTACVRCTLPACPGTARCEVPVVRWFRERSQRHAPDSASEAGKPRYTPYTQRATEVLLHEELGIVPRETLGQGMGPLTARMAYLTRALAGAYRLNENLLEVYPKATLTHLFPDPEPPPPDTPAAPAAPDAVARSARAPLGDRGRLRIGYRDSNGRIVTLDGPGGAPPTPDAGGLARAPLAASQVARLYKRSGHAQAYREQVLAALPGLSFGPGQWREFMLQSDHQFDSLLCAYTAFLWARDGWQLPPASADGDIFAEDGWIWVPPRPRRAPRPRPA